MHAKKSLGFIRAKKALGQNFLKSRAVASDLVRAAGIQKTDIVVEIGPGRGIITDFLLQKAARVIAVEKDARMIEYLKQKFSKEISLKKLILINDDILNFNPQCYKLQATSYKLVGSIPYYITGKFLRYFLSHNVPPKTVALIIQKEVARRITAKNGKESVLSISVKAYGEPHYIQTISRKLFSPEPKVDSAIIIIENISRDFFKNVSENLFFSLVKAGFRSKRKKVISNLKKQFPDIDWGKIFMTMHIPLNARAENIGLGGWRSFTEKLS